MNRGAVLLRSLAVAVAGLLILVRPADAQLTRVSVASDGTQANMSSFSPAISATGRYIAFVSRATNLVAPQPPCQANFCDHLYVHDRGNGQTIRLDLGTVQLSSGGMAISADGLEVAFQGFRPSSSGNSDIFVHNRQTGVIRSVSVSSDGALANRFSLAPSMTPDGRYVAFASTATNLVPGDTNQFCGLPVGAICADIFVHDRATASTTRVNVSTNGTQANGENYAPSISADGRYVAFSSVASSLVANDRNGLQDVFVHDRQAGITTRVSIGSGGVEGNSYSFASDKPSISGDGRYVVFNSIATTLVPGTVLRTLDRDGDVYVHDRLRAATWRVSTAVRGGQPNDYSRSPTISAGGRYLGFWTRATNLVSGDTNQVEDVFIHDLLTGTTTRVSTASTGQEANAASSSVMINATGDAVVFASNATNLVPGATNQGPQVYVAALDADADSLNDSWEARFGLNAASATGADGSGGDPDGDGLTNLQEYLGGTHPRAIPALTRYFAEGTTSPFFDTRLALLNVNPSAMARVLLRFERSDGTIASAFLEVPQLSRRTLTAKDLPALALAEFSTVIETDTAVVVDRTMTWDGQGYGSHAETGIPAPSSDWYLAEGATHSGFNLFYLIHNPHAQAVQVVVSYLLPAPAAPLQKTYTLPARSRFTIWVNQESRTLLPLAATDVSARLTSDRPIIVERAMYLDSGALPFGAGHVSAGVAAPALNWFLAEGATGDYFDEFVLVANPNAAASAITARFLLGTGTVITRAYTVAGNSRFNIWVDTVDPQLASAAVSTTLAVTNGVPVIAERAMWWPGPTAATWQEAHNSPGVTQTGTKWALAEGEQGGARSTQTYVLVANTSAGVAAIDVTLLFEDGTVAQRTFQMPPTSRFNVDVGALFPTANGKKFGVIVESTNGAQIVVERAMYSNANGVVWAAGTNALATRLQ